MASSDSQKAYAALGHAYERMKVEGDKAMAGVVHALRRVLLPSITDGLAAEAADQAAARAAAAPKAGA